MNAEVRHMLKTRGIKHQQTVAYNQQQNGKIEREMRTILEAARTMLQAAKIDKKFWAEAVNTAVYVINKTGTSTVAGVSPHEV